MYCMQLADIKISNLLSFPYHPDLSKTEGIKFYNNQNNGVNVLIWPNGAGKSGFLHILKQILKVGLVSDYVYDKKPILEQKNHNQEAIRCNKQYISWIHKHFRYQDKPSSVVVNFTLTEHDYDNMRIIAENTSLFNMLIKKYSTLNIQYPIYSVESVLLISSRFVVVCDFDVDKKTVTIDTHHMSQDEQFVLLYFQTFELIQICGDIYNEFERQLTEPLLSPLKNWIGFIGSNRSLRNVSSTVYPYARDSFVWDKNSSEYHSYIGFYLCAKKIRNSISDTLTLSVDKNMIGDYSQKLNQSEFYISLVSVIKKYFNRTLHIEYADSCITFVLIDQFGQRTNFDALSDWEQSLLSMIFSMYGYDLKDGILIIDEPEIHFHPQMQKSFSRMIEKIYQNIGTQFILSTYSPLFINESNISNVYRFSNINGETQIKKSYFNLSPDESTLVHLLKLENLSKIFFVNKIIMVEWETDAYFFEFYLTYLRRFPEWKNKIKDYEIININGKWWYKLRNNFLTKFGLQSFFIGDWDNIVDYGFMTQDDLWYYYKQAKIQYSSLKKSWKTHRHYNKLVDTISNIFPKKYTSVLSSINTLYKKNVFILKKWDIETYLDIQEKWLASTVEFCHHDFNAWLLNSHLDVCRQEFVEIFSHIFK